MSPAGSRSHTRVLQPRETRRAGGSSHRAALLRPRPPPPPCLGLAHTCQAGDISQPSPAAGLENAHWKKLSQCQLHSPVPERSWEAPLSSALLNAHACRAGSSRSLYKSQESQFLKRNKGGCVSKSHLLEGMGNFWEDKKGRGICGKGELPKEESWSRSHQGMMERLREWCRQVRKRCVQWGRRDPGA